MLLKQFPSIYLADKSFVIKGGQKKGENENVSFVLRSHKFSNEPLLIRIAYQQKQSTFIMETSDYLNQ